MSILVSSLSLLFPMLLVGHRFQKGSSRLTLPSLPLYLHRRLPSVRINRSSAQSRDEARKSLVFSPDDGCAQVFREMVGGSQGSSALLVAPLAVTDFLPFLVRPRSASWTNRAILLSYCTDVMNKTLPPAPTDEEVREATRKKPSEYSHKWEGEMEAPEKAGRRDIGRSEIEVLVSTFLLGDALVR